MQFTAAAIAIALTAIVACIPVSNAAQCTAAQQSEVEALEIDSTLDKACLQNDNIVPSLDTIDPTVWARASPCGNTACVTFLKAQAAKAPDCDLEKVNMKSLFAAQLALCVDLASGRLSADQIKQRVSNVTVDAV